MSDSKDKTCRMPSCKERVAWCRGDQFVGDYFFCDQHARAEEDFGQEHTGQFGWYWRDHVSGSWFPLNPRDRNGLVMTVDKPFSVKQFIHAARATGQDALSIANDPEAITALEASKSVTDLAAAARGRDEVAQPVDHHTREPHQPTFATIVEGEYSTVNNNDPGEAVAYDVTLTRKGLGVVEFCLTIDGKTCGQMPFDNLVKAATRIDPDHAVGAEKQIRELREQVAKARAEMYDWRAKAEQFELQVARLENQLRGTENT